MLWENLIWYCVSISTCCSLSLGFHFSIKLDESSCTNFAFNCNDHRARRARNTAFAGSDDLQPRNVSSHSRDIKDKINVYMSVLGMFGLLTCKLISSRACRVLSLKACLRGASRFHLCKSHISRWALTLPVIRSKLNSEVKSISSGKAATFPRSLQST